MSDCLGKVRGINYSYSLWPPLNEHAAVSKDEIPLGGEAALCVNITNALGASDWGESLTVKLPVSGFNNY